MSVVRRLCTDARGLCHRRDDARGDCRRARLSKAIGCALCRGREPSCLLARQQAPEAVSGLPGAPGNRSLALCVLRVASRVPARQVECEGVRSPLSIWSLGVGLLDRRDWIVGQILALGAVCVSSALIFCSLCR